MDPVYRDLGSRVSSLDCVFEPIWLVTLAFLAKKLIDVDESWSRDEALPADVPKPSTQVAKQPILQLIGRSEISVTSFAWERYVPGSVPEEARLTQTGARRDDGCVSYSSRIPFVKSD